MPQREILRGGRMLFQMVLALVVVLPFSRFAVDDGGVQSNAAGEYSKHFSALGKLSIAVAEVEAEGQTFDVALQTIGFEFFQIGAAIPNFSSDGGAAKLHPRSWSPPNDLAGAISESSNYLSRSQNRVAHPVPRESFEC